ncbi:MAG: hypothetical protein ACOVO0_11920, partial [Burkholderiaceae bacterium]
MNATAPTCRGLFKSIAIVSLMASAGVHFHSESFAQTASPKVVGNQATDGSTPAGSGAVTASRSGEPVVLNFVNAEIEAVAR